VASAAARPCGSNDPDHLAIGRVTSAAQECSHRPAVDRGDELGVLLGGLDEDAAQAGAAPRHQAHIVAKQQGRLGLRRGQVPIHLIPGQPPVRDYLAETAHHLCLGHDGQLGQVSQLKPGGVDPGEPGCVEG
jgi:hypothetical protein